jgi:predicted transglutaminase-like cysteine proteinase
VLASTPISASSKSKTYSIDTYPNQRAVVLQQWRSVLVRAARLTAHWKEVPCRDGAPVMACAATSAGRLEQRLRHLPQQQQVAGVYAFYDRFRYQRQRAASCGPDCWATPLEFIARRAGDCNDYVVAEYFALRHLGFPERSLQLVIVQLKGTGDPFGGGHVVLRVRLPDRDVVLDNRKDHITGVAALKGYRLLAGLNESSIEVFSAAPATETKVAAAPARASNPVRAEPVAAQSNAGQCVQSATLAQWNPNLACDSSGRGFRIIVRTKDQND